MTYLLSIEELQPILKRVDFEQKTRVQIEKDFATQDLEFDANFVSETGNIDKLIEEIAARIVQVMNRGERSLLQLLYTIDLPEKNFLAIVQEPDMPYLLAELILRREAYKVYLREKFA